MSKRKMLKLMILPEQGNKPKKEKNTRSVIETVGHDEYRFSNLEYMLQTQDRHGPEEMVLKQTSNFTYPKDS